MKKALIGLFVLLLLGGGGFAGWWFFLREVPADGTSDETAEAADATDATDDSEPSTDPPPDGRAKPGDLARLNVTTADGWTGRYDEFLHSWTFEKNGKTEDGTDYVSRFYIGHMPSEIPAEMHEYSRRLRNDPKFQDVGYVYAEVDDTEVYEDGWLIVGKVQDTTRPDDTPALGFALYRVIPGPIPLRCRGSVFGVSTDRDEAVAICRSARM